MIVNQFRKKISNFFHFLCIDNFEHICVIVHFDTKICLFQNYMWLAIQKSQMFKGIQLLDVRLSFEYTQLWN